MPDQNLERLPDTRPEGIETPITECFEPAALVFADGKYRTTVRDIETAIGVAGNRIRWLAELWPVKFSEDRWRECIRHGGALLLLFVAEDAREVTAGGIMHCYLDAEGCKYVEAVVHTFEPLDLIALSMIVESTAVLFGADKVVIATTGPSPMIDGYSRIDCGALWNVQISNITPIQ